MCSFVVLWLIPLAPHFDKLTSWIWGLVARDDSYGNGGAWLVWPAICEVPVAF